MIRCMAGTWVELTPTVFTVKSGWTFKPAELFVVWHPWHLLSNSVWISAVVKATGPASTAGGGGGAGVVDVDVGLVSSLPVVVAVLAPSPAPASCPAAEPLERASGTYSMSA